MAKYYDVTIDDAFRIAIVDGDDDNYEYGYEDDDEIAEPDLPADFNEWMTYTSYFNGAAVRVVSKNGD